MASSDSDMYDTSWIEWMLSRDENHFLCRVDESYIRDTFNLYGLRREIVNYDASIRTILGGGLNSSSDDDDLGNSIYDDARDLYGMIHQRFILTQRGLDAMHVKFESGDFGCCPNRKCSQFNLLPWGANIELGATTGGYCASCEEIYDYTCMNSIHGEATDGAYFGPTFAPLFFMVFSKCLPHRTFNMDSHTPRIYGFRVHPRARGFPVTSKQPSSSITIQKPETMSRTQIETCRTLVMEMQNEKAKKEEKCKTDTKLEDNKCTAQPGSQLTPTNSKRKQPAASNRNKVKEEPTAKRTRSATRSAGKRSTRSQSSK